MSIKKHTTYTWESPDGETLPIPFEFSCQGYELFKMSDDGLSAVLGVLGQDLDAQDPIEDWDNDMDGYYIIPSDATDPKGYADSTMETMEQYYNGEVYGVCIWSYTRDFAEYDLDGNGVPGEYTEWEEPEREECWGFYGYDYAEKELQEQFDATDFIKPASAGNSKQGELIL